MRSSARWIARLSPSVLCLGALVSARALARIGGGESFDSGGSSSGDGGDVGWIIEILLWLVLEHPAIGCPLLVIFVIGFVIWNRSTDGDASTRRAMALAEAERKTIVTASAVEGWVSALKEKDPQFDLIRFFDRTRRQFLELQEAWFRRDLEPVRRYLSDAAFQRLVVQLKLMSALGVRDAVADMQVFDLKILGLEQSDTYDSVHIAITAQARDSEASASASDDEARAQAQRAVSERFIEVWTFVRRHGALTKVEGDLSQGRCPSCGAPFSGGATNRCEFCGAIVNSGHFDWVLAEITQGAQHHRRALTPAGFAKARQQDPELTTEALEDRASLLFWKWVEAQAEGDARFLAKVATPALHADLRARTESLASSGRRTCFIDCAVGAVNTHELSQADGKAVAAVEVKWSARVGVAARGQRPQGLPSQPQRSVLLMERALGAKTSADAGMSTNRCPQCGAPLTDNGQPTCEFCGATLNSGERDWVLGAVLTWEQWRAQGGQPSTAGAAPVAAKVPDRDERERLVYLMAIMAKADGKVDEAELELLRMASQRWGVPWANVELALNAASEGFFTSLIVRGSAEAEAFLRELIFVARADGKIDSKERKLLQAAAAHLGLSDRLQALMT